MKQSSQNTSPLLVLENVKKHFPIKRGFFKRTVGSVKSVDGVSLTIGENETLGLVGESGSGKSTLGKAVVKLLQPTDGKILFRGKDVSKLRLGEDSQFLCDIQMIFQDPFGSLNPRHTVEQILDVPLKRLVKIPTRAKRRERAIEILQQVGLGSWALIRYPHEFSGGQRQRVAIARALAVSPKLIVADEATSALDVSVRAQILNLLKDLKKQNQMSFLMISHDMATIRFIADRVAVMYLGVLVEVGPVTSVLSKPLHPYTQALLSAVPDVKRKQKRVVLEGEIPSPANPPSGCRFSTRCPFAVEECRQVSPQWRSVGDSDGHSVACHLVRSATDRPLMTSEA